MLLKFILTLNWSAQEMADRMRSESVAFYPGESECQISFILTEEESQQYQQWLLTQDTTATACTSLT